MKKLPIVSPLFVFVLAVALTGCGEKAGGNAQATSSNTSAQTAAAQPAAQPAAIPGAWQGTIVETMDSGGYTYVLLDTGAQKVWCATNQTPVAVGDKVTIPQGQMMADFRSATLDRVFPEIWFTTAIWKQGSEPQSEMVPHDHAGATGGSEHPAEHPSEHPSEHPGAGAPAGDEMGAGVNGGTVSGTKLVLDDQHVDGVQKVAGGYKVEEIYAKGGELAGKSVKVRGRVVKFTPSIMGTNWVHIQDGSGQGDTVDLTVTTSAVVAVGDMVVAEGVLAVDKDFGAGYRYAAIIEKANVTKE